MKYAAIIGSREIDVVSEEKIQTAAYAAAQQGYILRSGHAEGCDFIAEKAYYDTGFAASTEIFIPWKNFIKPREGYKAIPLEGVNYICNVTEEALKLAEETHPAWSACSSGARLLHARNTQQVLGEHHDKPVDVVICWTPSGGVSGGTATAMRIAKERGILVFNLYNEEDCDGLCRYF